MNGSHWEEDEAVNGSSTMTTVMIRKMMKIMMMVKGSDDIALTFAEAWTSKTV